MSSISPIGVIVLKTEKKPFVGLKLELELNVDCAWWKPYIVLHLSACRTNQRLPHLIPSGFYRPIRVWILVKTFCNPHEPGVGSGWKFSLMISSTSSLGNMIQRFKRLMAKPAAGSRRTGVWFNPCYLVSHLLVTQAKLTSETIGRLRRPCYLSPLNLDAVKSLLGYDTQRSELNSIRVTSRELPFDSGKSISENIESCGEVGCIAPSTFLLFII